MKLNLNVQVDEYAQNTSVGWAGELIDIIKRHIQEVLDKFVPMFNELHKNERQIDGSITILLEHGTYDVQGNAICSNHYESPYFRLELNSNSINSSAVEIFSNHVEKAIDANLLEVPITQIVKISNGLNTDFSISISIPTSLCRLRLSGLDYPFDEENINHTMDQLNVGHGMLYPQIIRLITHMLIVLGTVNRWVVHD